MVAHAAAGRVRWPQRTEACLGSVPRKRASGGGGGVELAADVSKDEHERFTDLVWVGCGEELVERKVLTMLQQSILAFLNAPKAKLTSRWRLNVRSATPRMPECLSRGVQ
jgi:hypothetical protein